MIAQVAALGRSFKGVTAYVTHDAPAPGQEAKPTTDDRVEWTETRNLASDRPADAWRVMAATAKAAPGLKRLAGVPGAGRKAAKPVYHYALSWKPGESPDRAEMNRAVDESLKKLGMEDRQALVVAHNDTPHRHVHVIVNRVDPETGRTAGIGHDRLKLANWAERWERERGKLQCPARAVNREKRQRAFVKGKSLPPGRYRREQMPLGRPEREPPPTGVDAGVWSEAESGAWDYAEHLRSGSGVSARAGREWAAQLAEQAELRATVERESRTVGGRFRIWRAAGGSWRELAGAVLGRAAVLDGWRKELDRHQKEERAALGKAHQESAGEYERGVRRTYARDARRAVGGVLQARWTEAREREGRELDRTPRRAPDRGRDRDFGPSR